MDRYLMFALGIVTVLVMGSPPKYFNMTLYF